jgi:hypothetical protein
MKFDITFSPQDSHKGSSMPQSSQGGRSDQKMSSSQRATNQVRQGQSLSADSKRDRSPKQENL